MVWNEELGGPVTIITNKNDGYYRLAASDQTHLVNFVVAKAK